MTHRLLLKLDVLKQYTMKRLAKYEKVESQRLGKSGKVHLSSLVKSPLVVELKLDCELPSARRSNALPPAESSYHRETWDHLSSFDWSAAHLGRKKPALRSSSAPNNLKTKPSDQKGKPQTLDGGFVVLKLNQKLKSLHVTTEGQKRPKRISDDESKTLGHPDTSHYHSPAAATRWAGQKTVAAEKGDKTDESGIHGEISNQDVQQLKKDNKVRFSVSGHLLPCDPNTRKDTYLENSSMTKEEEFKKSTIDSKDSLKEKKSYIPLSIEDEMEKPNAKIIRVDLPKTKPPTPMKMSETHPVLCNNEEYLTKFIFDKYTNLYGGTPFCDTSVVFTQVNPVLQNNYNETLEILRSQYFAARVTAKKKKKPTLFSKRKLLSAGILSRELKGYNPIHSQTQKRAGQKTSRCFPMRRVNEISVSQPIHKGTTHKFLVCGENPGVNVKVDICHEIGSSGGVSGKKRQGLGNAVTSAVEVDKKRVIFVDYVPISKPVKMYKFGDELLCYDSPLSAHTPSAINDCTEGKANGRERLDVSQEASDTKAFLDQTSLDSEEFSGYPPSFEEGSEISSSTISTSSSRCFQTELSADIKSLEEEEEEEEEEQHIMPSHSAVISIPTAQCDTSESSRG